MYIKIWSYAFMALLDRPSAAWLVHRERLLINLQVVQLTQALCMNLLATVACTVTVDSRILIENKMSFV